MRDMEIFTVVVADDEAELLQAVCELIPWEKIGFRLAGRAANGLDALQLVEQLQPDLLLTDIRMPFITGTSLARQVRELQPLIQVAFLSGYDDFEYAQMVIDAGVISYLLKPISMADLTRALAEIHGKMEARFRNLMPEGDPGRNLPLAAATVLLDTLDGEREEADLRRMLADSGFSIPARGSFVVLSVGSASGKPAGDRMAQTVDRVLQSSYASCSFPSGSRVLTLIAVEEPDLYGFRTALDELYNAVCRLADPDCVIGVSRRFSDLTRCNQACREATEIQRQPGGGGIRYCRLAGEGSGERRRDGVRALCDQTIRLIEQEYMDETLSLSSVSDRLHVSPNYLSANMKKYAGDTFINLLIKRRMEAARDLLADGGMKIAEVAVRCGYSDQHYFSFCFKKYYGVPPARMRRREDETP